MRYVLLLNLSSVTFIRNLGSMGWRALEGIAGWEAVSPFGEIQAFATQAEAERWRRAQVREAAGLIRFDETIYSL